MRSALTLQLFQVLRALQDSGSVTRAARAVGVSQPAVSKLLAKAEQDLGVTLLRRDTRPVRLTDEGLLIAQQGAEVLRLTDTLSDRVQALRRGQAGQVRIGSFGPTASTRLLPPLLAGFARRYPGIELRVTEAPDAQTQADLASGVLDVAVLANPSDEMDVIPLATDRLVGLVAAQGPLADRGQLAPADLAAHPFVMTLAGSESVIRAWFAEAGCAPDVRHRLQQTHSIVALVRQGLGNSIVTSLSLPADLEGLRAIPLTPVWENEVSLVRPAGTVPSRAVALFWRYVDGRP